MSAYSQMDMESEDYHYNNLVKQRLIAWKENFEASMGGVELNYSAIEKVMHDRFHIETTAAKIGAMFDITKTRKIQLQELTALAQIFDIPLWDICAHPTAATSNMNYSNLVRAKNKTSQNVQAVRNHFYEGEYWCYYFKPKHFDGQIKPVEESNLYEAKLEIKIAQGHTRMTFQEMKITKTFAGEPMPNFTLSGDLYLFEKTDIAYCFMADPTNSRATALMFSYLDLSADVRYYMTAGMLTFSMNQAHVPLFQKMAIFRKRQDFLEEEKGEVIRGILALNSTPIVMDKGTIAKLAKEDEIWAKLLTPEKALEECLLFTETTLRDSLYKIADEDEKTKRLLQLRKHSLLPAHETIIEGDALGDFIKEYQCT